MLFDEQERARLAAATAAETQRGIMAFRARAAETRAANARPPQGWRRPPYGTPEFWQAYGYGWISDEQAQEASRRAERARASLGTLARPPRRWGRAEPRETRQYANAMATTAARDNRLTPQAKALLQVLRARCGNGLETRTTKTTLADILSRHVRTIQRYIQELVRFGYITIETRTNERGSHTGLIVRLCQKVLPFWKEDGRLAEWLEAAPQEPKSAYVLDFTGRTKTSPINYSPNSFYLMGVLEPLRQRMRGLRDAESALAGR